ncbi:MAG: T9SS type A sorting domain-containing protein [Bacteroidetes bacterium]|nr:T9SS type A sorting domain-containing protein [Bacteroidota bacterium]MBS1930175.1 T9SS type A sorting domain-containing protein [Bacteroidota bacterium]
MKIWFGFVLFIAVFTHQLAAQVRCSTFEYQQEQLLTNPSLQNKINAIEAFTKKAIKNFQNIRSRLDGNFVIRIPVVVHILYHDPSEDISDNQVMEQIEALNRDYRRLNADTVNTPSYFKPVAADCNIEFLLATSDPMQRSTTGIIRKYTPIRSWDEDDKMKFSASLGDDAWDATSYLNIWVCNIKGILGYSSFVGGPANVDGVVINTSVFGQSNTISTYDKGRTAVHEVGHWLNLKHLWGDTDCGDDSVADTPKQSTYTVGCPSGIRISCDNAPNGNMYMNYMDFTYDDCMNMFTQGQKERMRALFESEGPRYSILFSRGLDTPLIYQTPKPDEPPQWLHPQIYPNPASNDLYLDVEYDVRWIGKTVNLINLQGKIVKQVVISSEYQKIDISSLAGGMYFLFAKKEDGATIRMKFIKQ